MALALVLISFSSCSKIKESLTVKVPVEFTNDIQVKAGTSGLKSSLEYEFMGVVTFNPSTDPTIIKYKQKIKDITINGISFTPTGLTGDVTIQSAALAIKAGLGGMPEDYKIVWILPATTLKNGVKVDLPTPSAGTYADISTLLDGDQELSIMWNGYQDTPVLPYVISTALTADVVAYLLKQ